MHLGLGLKNVTLQLAPSVGRARALASAMADYGGIKLLPVGVHQEDRCGDGTNCTKASPPYFVKHIVVVVTQLPPRPTLLSVDYVGRVVKRNVVLGASGVRRVPQVPNQVLDRTKVLHDPRTQAYGETRR